MKHNAVHDFSAKTIFWIAVALIGANWSVDASAAEIVGARVLNGPFPHVDEERFIFWPRQDPASDAFLYGSTGDVLPMTWGDDDALYITGGDGYGSDPEHPQFGFMEVGINYTIPNRDHLDDLTDVPTQNGGFFSLRTPPKMNFGRFWGEPGTLLGMAPSGGEFIWKIHELLAPPTRQPLEKMVLSGSLISIDGIVYIAYHVFVSAPLNPIGHGFDWNDRAGIMKWNGNAETPEMTMYSPADNAYVAYNAENIEDKSVWGNFRFIAPGFIQFGRDYADYAHYAGSGIRTVYAISPHNTWQGRDRLFLGRATLTPPPPGFPHAMWGEWEYWIGMNENGKPLWSRDVDRAKSIVDAPGELSLPSIVYERHSGQFLMAAYANHDDYFNLSTNDKHYGVWAAPDPWGPWRRIYTSDYNGLQYRAAQEVRHQGGGGQDVHLVPKWITEDDGTVRMWISTSGFWVRDYEPLDTIIETDWEAWDKKFTQNYENMAFTQIKLTNSDDPRQDYHATAPMALRFSQGNAPTFHADPVWVGCRLRTGPDPLTVEQLGRFYVSGNRHAHDMMLLKVEDNGTSQVIARAVADMSEAVAPDEHGFQYGAIDGGPVALAADTEYCLLSREGLTSDSNVLRAEARTDLSGTDRLQNAWSGFVGFEFKTGPLGMRVTHVARWNTGSTGSEATRAFVIDEIVTMEPVGNPTAFGTTRALEAEIDAADPVDEEGYRVHELAQPVDLKPLTRYFIGTYTETGDAFYGGPFGAGGPGMPRLSFDPNVLQFIKAAFTIGPDGDWMVPGEDHRDIGALFGPVTFRCQVPDRFFGTSPEDAEGEPIDAMPRLLTNAGAGVRVECAGSNAMWGWQRIDDRRATFGPIDLVVERDGGEVPLVTGFASTAWQGHPRTGEDSFDGFAGMQIVVGRRDLTLTKIGRYVDGDRLMRDHQLILTNISDNFRLAEATLAAGDVTGRKSPLGFVYVDLNEPYTLEAGRTYFVGSTEEEQNSADPGAFDPSFGFASDVPILETGSAVEILGPVKIEVDGEGNPGPLKHYVAAEGGCFGPVGMRTTPLDRSAVDTVTPRLVTANWTGFHGMTFRTGERPLAVRALGRWRVDGNSRMHEVRIQPVEEARGDAVGNPSPMIASVTIDASDSGIEGFQYELLATPVLLEANTEYFIGSYETVDGDRFAADVTLTPDAELIEIVGGAYTSEDEDGAGGPWYRVASDEAGRVLGGVDFKIQ